MAPYESPIWAMRRPWTNGIERRCRKPATSSWAYSVTLTLKSEQFVPRFRGPR